MKQIPFCIVELWSIEFVITEVEEGGSGGGEAVHTKSMGLAAHMLHTCTKIITTLQW